MKLLMKTRTQKKYATGLKPFKCPPSPTVCLKRYYSEISIKNQQLNPYFVSGFVDAEGSFVISIIRKSKGIKWAVRARFNIALHSKDLPLLRSIQTFFGGIGSIYESKDGKSVSFVVCKSEDLTTLIIPHFLKYPLVTQK